MDNTEFTKIYSILGVFQDDGWEMIRAAYKKQIKRWHPDRFQDPTHRKIAEEKSKEINQAYQKLSEYYEKFGTLPPDHSPQTASIEASQPSTVVETESHENSYAHGFASVQPAQSAGRRSYISITVVGTIMALGYSLWEPEFMDHPNSSAFVHQPDIHETNLTTHSELDLNGDVPVKNPNEYEGTSQEKDAILDANIHTWKTQENRATHAVKKPGTSQNYKTAFEIEDTAPANQPVLIKKGSSKSDVLVVQGPPQRQTDTAWDYGASRIYFQDGHVSGWHENPMNPLNIAR